MAPSGPGTVRAGTDLRRQVLARALCAAGVLLTAATLAVTAARAAGPAARSADVLPGALTVLVLGGGMASVALLLTVRRPEHPVGWLYATGTVLATGSALGDAIFLAARDGQREHELVARVAGTLGWALTPPAILLLLTLPFLLLPDGRFRSSRWRWVGVAAVAGAALEALHFLLQVGPIGPDAADVRNPFGVDALGDLPARAGQVGVRVLLVATLLAAAQVVLRYAAARGAERQQLRWVAAGGVLACVGTVQLVVVGIVDGSDGAVASDVSFALGLLAVPVSVAVAVLRHRLHDLDVVLDRSLVYATLSVALLVAYLVVVGAVRLVLPGRDTLGSVLATAAVAVSFAPLRAGLQRVVDRWLHGDRDDPYAAVSRLAARLEAALRPEEVLPSLVATVAESLRLPYAAVELAPGGPPAAEHGRLAGEPLRLPLVHRGTAVGTLVVGPRQPGTGFSAADRRVLAGLAASAGAAVDAVRLTAELQRSRTRLVTAREEERRRLRRDLHDGLGPTLAGIVLGLETAGNLLDRAPGRASTLLGSLRDEARAAVDEVRGLVDGLRPTALDDLGLVAALRARAEALGRDPDGTALDVRADGDLDGLAAAVEVAAYRIAAEAMRNAARHSGARRCTATLRHTDGALEVEVRDDGRGLAGDRPPGVGILSMRERAAELGGTLALAPASGGGTTVTARLPTGA